MDLYMKVQNLLTPMKDERGQDMIEYAIMLGIIAVAVIGSVTTVATYVTNAWATLAAQL